MMNKKEKTRNTRKLWVKKKENKDSSINVKVLWGFSTWDHEQDAVETSQFKYKYVTGSPGLWI
jgi:hypothetical protein